MAWIIEMPLSVRALYAELPWNSFGEFAAALCSHDDAITAFSDIVIVIGNEEIHTLASPDFTWEILINVRKNEVVLTVEAETYFRNPHLKIARILYRNGQPSFPVDRHIIGDNNFKRGRLGFQIAKSEVNRSYHAHYRRKNPQCGKGVFDKFKIIHGLKSLLGFEPFKTK